MSPPPDPSDLERLASPGERHRSLAPLIGEWRIAMTTHPEGAGTIRSDEVRARKSWFGEGRYVREEVSGTFGGRPHEKLTILGFNNGRCRYEYVTADNNDAVILLYVTSPGAELGDGRRLDLFTEYVSVGDRAQAIGKLVTIRTSIEIMSDDEHRLRNFYKEVNREEYMFLEYLYRREVR